ncbi:unnamed protein product [Mucor hiemalis]
MQTPEERERKIANVLETYFSDASLQWDKLFLSKMKAYPDQMLTFDVLSKLPKFKIINALPEEIRKSAESHSLKKLKILDEGNKIGRIKPYVVNKKQELDEWSIYVEGLDKPYNNEQKIVELFNSLVGHVSFFRVPPNQHGSRLFFGYCFIEFDNKDNVQRAVDMLNKGNNKDSIADANTKLIHKLNLRVMTKIEWNRYKEEYLQVMERCKENTKQLWDDFYTEYPDGNYEPPASKSYTEGIIVFVDGLHLQCSKTIATKLLETSGFKIEFMNIKKKGLSSTHIRLSDPDNARKMCDYFTQHHVVQETGQDTNGQERDTHTFDCLKLRVIRGTEEEIYWEKESKKLP